MNDKDFDNDDFEYDGDDAFYDANEATDDFDEPEEGFGFDDEVRYIVDSESDIEYLELEDVLNEEELLNLALMVLDAYEVNDVADRIVMRYAINDLIESGVTEFTGQEVSDKCNDLIIGYTLKSMVEGGEIEPNFDEDGEVRYTLTEQGFGMDDVVTNKEEE